MTRFDLLVIGAGPAGAAAALAALAVKPGARVGLVDKAEFPRDKVCGDGITPASVNALNELGAADVLSGYAPIAALGLSSPSGRSARLFTRGLSYVVPRRVFDARLVDLAVGRGAELLREKVVNIRQAADHVVVNERYTAPYVIGADGANSVVRRQVAGSRQPDKHTALAMRGYATVAREDPRLQAWFLYEPKRSYAWLFTDGSGAANVGCGVFDRSSPMSRELLVAAIHERFPDLDLHEATLRAHKLPLSTNRPVPVRGRVLLAGDAASLVNPLTGEGIHTALVSGALAGNAAVRADSPCRGSRTGLRRALAGHLLQTAAAARALRNPRVIEAAVDASAMDRRVGEEVATMALGAGTVSPQGMLRIASRYLTNTSASATPPAH